MNIQKGIFTAKSLIIGLVIIVILVLVLVFMPKSTVAPIDVDNNQTATTTATTTPQIDTTATSTATTTTNINQTKTYANATLGLAFNYPNDFFVRKEGFSANGAWSALLVADRGDITVSVVKGPIQTKDIKMQTTSIKINGKDAILYNTRRDNGCDAAIAETRLDDEYSLQFTFLSCSDKLGSIFKNREDILATLGSVAFANVNSRLIVETKRGFAFRYPIEWAKATYSNTNNLTKIVFGTDAYIEAGAQYSSTLKRNLTYTEVVTGALTTPNTVRQEMTVAGKTATMLTTTPSNGSKKRAVYIANSNATDLIIISHNGVDADGLNLILNSLSFFK